MMTNTLHSFCLTSVTSPVKTSPSYVTCHHWSNSIWWLEVSTWFEVTESVTLPWKSALIISILTFPSINCMQCLYEIPITGGALSKTFVKPRASALFWRSLVDTFTMQIFLSDAALANCLHWLQLPFVDALCSPQFVSKHHRFHPLVPFHVRLQSSSTLYLFWIFFPAVEQLPP